MSLKTKCIRSVNDRFEERRQKNLIEMTNRKTEVYQKIPQMESLEEEMKANMSAFMQFMFKSEDRDEEKFQNYRRKATLLQAQRLELLFAAGYPTDYLDEIYTCPECKDTGTVGQSLCGCYKKEMSLEYLRLSGLERILSGQSFADFSLRYYSDRPSPDAPAPRVKMEALKKYCERYVEGFAPGARNLLFYGPPGCGKSFLSAAVGKALIDKGYFVL